MPMDRDYRDALRWVNARRALWDMPVILTFPRWRGCIDPLEAAFQPLSCRVSATTLSVKASPGLLVIELPPVVARFLMRVDRGDYDDLLAPVHEGCSREIHLARCEFSVTQRLARRRAMP